MALNLSHFSRKHLSRFIYYGLPKLLPRPPTRPVSEEYSLPVSFRAWWDDWNMRRWSRYIYFQTVNSYRTYFSLEDALEFCWGFRRRAQNFTIVDQAKHKIKQIYIRNNGPWLPDLICNVIYIIFSMEFLWPRNRGLSCETSLAARSKERWLYSQANQRYAHNNPGVLAGIPTWWCQFDLS